MTNFPGSIFWSNLTLVGEEPLTEPTPAGNVWTSGHAWDRYPDQVMHELLTRSGSPFPDDHPVAIYETSVSGPAWSLWEARLWTNPDISGKWNPHCVDMLPIDASFSFTTWQFPSLLCVSGTEAACADVRHYCDSDDAAGFQARLFCPETCGCHQPLTRVGRLTELSGCPTPCTTFPRFQDALRNASCEDTEQDWEAIAAAMIRVASMWSPPARRDVAVVAAVVKEEGCKGIARLRAEQSSFDMCDESFTKTMPLGSFRFVCPVACQCWGGLSNCPHSCHPLQ